MKFNTGIYISFILLYVASFIYNLRIGSTWWIDAVLTALFLTVMFMLKDNLAMGRLEFSLLNLGLLFHNLGTFGFYESTFAGIGYDKFIHFTGAGITAFIAMKFITSRLSFNIRLRRFDDTKIITAGLAIGLVMLLGVGIELLEFIGYSVLDIEGSGVGVLGIGDPDVYLDTILDLSMNLIGAVAGVLVFLFSRKI